MQYPLKVQSEWYVLSIQIVSSMINLYEESSMVSLSRVSSLYSEGMGCYLWPACKEGPLYAQRVECLFSSQLVRNSFSMFRLFGVPATDSL